MKQFILHITIRMWNRVWMTAAGKILRTCRVQHGELRVTHGRKTDFRKRVSKVGLSLIWCVKHVKGVGTNL
jgi:hypothetical protein